MACFLGSCSRVSWTIVKFSNFNSGMFLTLHFTNCGSLISLTHRRFCVHTRIEARIKWTLPSLFPLPSPISHGHSSLFCLKQTKDITHRQTEPGTRPVTLYASRESISPILEPGPEKSLSVMSRIFSSPGAKSSSFITFPGNKPVRAD
jgi:hypothetical protein